MHKKLTKVFGSKMKADEILYLFANQKFVVRQAFYDQEFTKVEKFCKINNIYHTKSKFKVLFADENSENFSNKGIVLEEDDKRQAPHFYYFSKDEAQAYLAAFYELTGQDGAFGLILGYPKCCVDYFAREFSAKNPNPEINSPNPHLNLSKRDQDAVLIAHFPCSSDCRHSLVIAKNNLDILEKNAPERAKELKSKLF